MRERGCDWTGTVGLRDTALKGMRVPSRDVSSEVCRVGRREERGSGASGEETADRAREREFCSQRELKCEFCGGAVRACEMNPHLGVCEEFPIDCPNGCEAAGETGTGQMRRGAVPLHLSECPLQRVESGVSLSGVWLWRGDGEETAGPPRERIYAHSLQTSYEGDETVGIHMYTEEQIFLLKHFTFDANGCKIDKAQKAFLYFASTIRHPEAKLSPIPIAEMLGSEQTMV